MAKFFTCIVVIAALATAQCSLPLLNEGDVQPLRFHAIGDQGFYPIPGSFSSGEALFEQTKVEQENGLEVYNAIVAEKMNDVAANAPIDFVMALGDNFYLLPNGLKNINDPRMPYMFSHTYNHPNLKVPFYAILGNHDCYGDPQIQVQETQHQDQWNMPNNYYEQVFDLDNGKKALFLMLDGCIMSCADTVKSGGTCDNFSYDITSDIVNTHMTWLVGVLDKYAADDTIAWKTIAVHWPFFSVGHSHGDTDALKNNLMPLVAKYGIDVILSGHDHNSQYINMSIETYNAKGVTPANKSRDSCTIKPITTDGGVTDLHFNQGEHVHQFVAGNSGVPPGQVCTSRETPDENLVYAYWVNGFIEVEMTSQYVTVRNWAIYTDDYLSQVTIHAAGSPASTVAEDVEPVEVRSG